MRIVGLHRPTIAFVIKATRWEAFMVAGSIKVTHLFLGAIFKLNCVLSKICIKRATIAELVI